MLWLTDLHFLRPWWLLVVIPPLLVALERLLRDSKNDQWNQVIAPHLLRHLVVSQQGRSWLSPQVLLVPVTLLVAIAMAGPAYRLADTPNTPDNTTLLVVVDLSSSMSGKDVGPSRVGRLRLKLRDLINLRRGARIGLLAVAGSAHVVMPPTDDGDALIPYVDVLDPQLMPEDGENFAPAADLARGLSQGEAGPTVVLVAGDSIPPEGAAAFAELQKAGVQVIGWMVGTGSGDPGSAAPALDETGFDQLERAGAQIVHLSLGGSDLRDINQLLDRARTASVNPQDASLWEDSGYGLVFVIALCLLFWFRRGWVLSRASLVLLVSLLTGCTSAAGESPWLSPWLTPDQQGRRLFEQGKYKEAARAFRDPMWKGIAYYTAHDWQRAGEEFSRVDTAPGLFNLANAHAQAREIASAVAAYNRALARQPTFAAARLNRDYFQDVLSGLEQTSDFDDLTHPDDRKADATAAKLRKDQLQGPKDRAAEAEQQQEAKKKDTLTAQESQQWMKNVATDPADFLRAKFSMQAQGEKQ